MKPDNIVVKWTPRSRDDFASMWAGYIDPEGLVDMPPVSDSEESITPTGIVIGGDSDAPGGSESAAVWAVGGGGADGIMNQQQLSESPTAAGASRSCSVDCL